MLYALPTICASKKIEYSKRTETENIMTYLTIRHLLKTIIINSNQEINCMYGVPGTTVHTCSITDKNKTFHFGK
jgi:hypothetical protein